MNKNMLKIAILEEIEKMMDEDALIKDPSAKDSHVRGDDLDLVVFDKFNEEMCEQCGGKMYEKECMECGYMKETMINEGNCGCSSSDDGSDYSLDSMMTPIYGANATSMHIDFPHHGEIHKYKHNNYMAKPALYKVAKYAQKLLHMIPDGYELDDWQRTKIAQISDDISEVYHSLDYDFSYDDEH
jgi:hypothetical protein